MALPGVELILERRPDLALVDIAMPGLDGYSVARRVRGPAGLQRPAARRAHRLRARGGPRPRAPRRFRRSHHQTRGPQGPASRSEELHGWPNPRAPPGRRTARRRGPGGRKDPGPVSCRAASSSPPCARLKRGEFDTRLPDDLGGVDGQICEAFNDLVAMIGGAFATRCSSCARRWVARGGRSKRLRRGDAPRRLGASTSARSTTCSTTSRRTPTRSRGWSRRSSRGDLTQTLDVEGVDEPLRGDFLKHARAVNGMVEQLGALRLRGDPRRPGGGRAGQARRPGRRAGRLGRVEGAHRLA